MNTSLPDEDLRTLHFAAYQLEHLKKHLSNQQAQTRIASYTAVARDRQLEHAHSILVSEAMEACFNNSASADIMKAQLLSALAEYLSIYGNAYGEAAPFI